MRFLNREGACLPGVITPVKLSGSAALIETSAPSLGSLLIIRSLLTASVNANCSPQTPSTNLPPLISPLASRFRKTRTSSLQGGAKFSQSASLRNTTPYLLRRTLAMVTKVSLSVFFSSLEYELVRRRDQRPAPSILKLIFLLLSLPLFVRYFECTN